VRRSGKTAAPGRAYFPWVLDPAIQYASAARREER